MKKLIIDGLLLLGYSGAYEGEISVMNFQPTKELQHFHFRNSILLYLTDYYDDTPIRNMEGVV